MKFNPDLKERDWKEEEDGEIELEVERNWNPSPKRGLEMGQGLSNGLKDHPIISKIFFIFLRA